MTIIGAVIAAVCLAGSIAFAIGTQSNNRAITQAQSRARQLQANIDQARMDAAQAQRDESNRALAQTWCGNAVREHHDQIGTLAEQYYGANSDLQEMVASECEERLNIVLASDQMVAANFEGAHVVECTYAYDGEYGVLMEGEMTYGGPIDTEGTGRFTDIQIGDVWIDVYLSWDGIVQTHQTVELIGLAPGSITPWSTTIYYSGDDPTSCNISAVSWWPTGK